jgi:TniQ
VNILPLPRSLDPLPNESLPGYVLRLAHRLDLTPTALAIICGLGNRRQRSPASSIIFALDPHATARFAHATRLSSAEVTELTLVSLAAQYPPLDMRSVGRQRQVHGVFIRENWIFARSTRYCPDCLAGDESPIQQRHGGAWSKLWRLPVVFACPTHRRLLRHACPACQSLAHQRTAGSPHLLPMAAHPVVHPAACRNKTTAGPPFRLCGHRLDRQTNVKAEPRPVGDESLITQQRLLQLLGASPPPKLLSVELPTTPARYFVDLRIVSALLQASWPAGRDLANSADVPPVDVHVRRLGDQIASARSAGQRVYDMLEFDRPPIDAAASAVLLNIANAILAGNASTVREILRQIYIAAPFAREWTRRYLVGDGYCSPGLRAVAGVEAGAQHIIKNLGITLPAVQPPPRPVTFRPRHIPQHLPTTWHDAYFANFAEIDQRWLRRAVPVLLVQICAGGSIRRAGPLLDLPWSAGRHAINVVTAQLRDHPVNGS